MSGSATDGVSIAVAHTSEVDAAVLAASRALLDRAFAGDFADDDWEHALGGMHVVATLDGAIVGHAAVGQRHMALDGRVCRVGYVEGVAVRSDRQRLGIGGRLMEQIERIIRTAYDFGALGATDEGLGLYVRRGWVPWEGPLAALTPDGPVDTPEEAGAVLVLPGARHPDVRGRLVCDYRDGDLW